jgi:hypothetical protein
MRHHRSTVVAVLTVGLLLVLGHWADAADRAADLADRLNSQWAPNPPAYSAESVGQQRGPDKLGGWGGVLIGNLIAQDLAKSLLAAPNNTLTPAEALARATQQVMDARQGPGAHGWGRITQDLTGQKLGDLMKGAQPATASTTGQSLSGDKSAKGVGKSAGNAVGKIDQGFSNSFSTPAQTTGVVVSGPGGSSRGSGGGHDKGASGKDVADRGGNHDPGRGGGDGRGGGNGAAGGGGNGGGGGGGGGGNGGGGGKGH